VNYSLVALFGIVAAVALGSSFFFRRRSLGTSWRIGLSVAAVGLLAFRFIRDHDLSSGKLALLIAAAAILGSGVWVLQREELNQQPPRE
jgi:hypothetical protein